MGVSSDGMLVFGIDLEDAVALSDMFDYDEYSEEFEDVDFEDLIARECGLPRWSSGMTDEQSSEYFDNRKKATESYPVSLVWHCSYEYPMYIVSIPGYEYSASRGCTEEISLGDLTVPQDKIDAMKLWCSDHNIAWKEPEWLLCSMFG